MRALVAAGGWAHSPDAIASSMSSLLDSRGYETSVVTNPDTLLQELHQGVELLVMGPCWFSMSDDRYTADQRDQYAVRISDQLKDALRLVVQAGTPLLALHTAVLCFDGWSEWSDWLGAEWNWTTSFHPPPSELAVRVTADAGVTLETKHPLTDFTVFDEEYQGLDLHDHVGVVAESAAGHPLVWVSATASARVAVDLLGHDERSLDEPGHQLLLNGLLDWLTDNPSPRRQP